MHSVVLKRVWQNKTPEEKAKFSAKRSKIQKRVFAKYPRLRKMKSESFKKVAKKYWNNISEEQKAAHIKKMSAGMKKAWDESDENFGPRIANKENIKLLNGDFEIERDLPRINDYAGVITASELTTL
jgi:hypothetical protein